MERTFVIFLLLLCACGKTADPHLLAGTRWTQGGFTWTFTTDGHFSVSTGSYNGTYTQTGDLWTATDEKTGILGQCTMTWQDNDNFTCKEGGAYKRLP
jgi:hypothetical protein